MVPLFRLVLASLVWVFSLRSRLLSFLPQIDPAIERWNSMRENVYKNFRFTSKTSRQVFVYGAVVPALIGAICYYNDVSALARLIPRPG